MKNEISKVAENAMDFEITAADIKNNLCPIATEKEVYMALNIIKSYHLNPFKREVHLIKYKSDVPISIVVGYEVYIKRAERTGKLNGWSASISKDGTSATVTIFRKDWDKPFEWTVLKKEADKGQAIWKTAPEFMLKKVAIAQGFRLAFPDELGGMPYTSDEMNVGSAQQEPKTGKPEVSMPKAVVATVDPEEPVEPKNSLSELFIAQVGSVIETVEAKIIEARDGKVKGMDICDYIVSETITSNSIATIRTLGKKKADIGNVVKFSKVLVSEKAGEIKYSASEITVII